LLKEHRRPRFDRSLGRDGVKQKQDLPQMRAALAQVLPGCNRRGARQTALHMTADAGAGGTAPDFAVLGLAQAAAGAARLVPQGWCERPLQRRAPLCPLSDPKAAGLSARAMRPPPT
jgi:hypothetical protein